MPGVPPDAVDNVKRLLKGMFRRGTKSKHDAPTEPIANTSTTHAGSQPPVKPDALAVQQTTSNHAPAVQEAPAATPTTATTTPPDTNKQLPTQPGDTAPAPASAIDAKVAAAAAAAPDQTTSHLSSAPQANSQGVSPAAGTPANSAPVSAADTPPTLPPKTEAEPAAPPQNVKETASEQLHTESPPPSTTEKEAVPAAASAKPVENAAPTSTAPSGGIEPAPTPAAGDVPAIAGDDKPPVHAQPPTVQPAQVASDGTPGMSATSGPLEDFPEGTTK